MEATVSAAIIEALGTCAAAVIIGLFAWLGISRELRHRQRMEHRRQLFLASLRDSMDFVREVKDVIHALGGVVYEVMQKEQAGGMPLARRVEQEMAGYGRSGALVPPELTSLRNDVQAQIRSLRALVMGSVSDLGQMNRANEVIRKLTETTQSFSVALENWKSRHWHEGKTKAVPRPKTTISSRPPPPR
jgi:hypothetical protein